MLRRGTWVFRRPAHQFLRGRVAGDGLVDAGDEGPMKRLILFSFLLLAACGAEVGDPPYSFRMSKSLSQKHVDCR